MLSILRIGAGFMFMLHGTQKLFAFPVAEPRDTVATLSLMGLAGIIETLGGLLILVGYRTRAAAFICSGQMAVAYFMAHLPRSIWPVLNGGEAAAFYSLFFLFLVFSGPGRLSLDAVLGKEA